jgi:hypothetical protein
LAVSSTNKKDNIHGAASVYNKMCISKDVQREAGKRMESDKKSSLTRKLARVGGWQIAKRIIKPLPIAGTALAIGLTGYSIKKKGLIKGVIHSALDATPIVGTAKSVVELFTGDLIPDKPENKGNKR